MAGLVHHGARRDDVRRQLQKAARKAAVGGVELLIEPINRRDIPGYFLNKTAEARAIIHEVGEPNLGLQLDLYHRQIEEGDVAKAIAEFGPLARHYQIASPPDRGEPDAGELNYRWLFKADRRQRVRRLGRLRVQAPPRHGRRPQMGGGVRRDVGMRRSSRASSRDPSGRKRRACVDSWIPGTRPGMTKRESEASMKVLIIGGAGMIGRKLGERLARDGELGGKAISSLTLHDVVEAPCPQARRCR